MINQRADDFRRLYAIAQALHEEQGNTPAMLRRALTLAGEALDLDRMCIVTLDDDGGILDAYLAESNGCDDEDTLWVALAGQVQLDCHTVNVTDLSELSPLAEALLKQGCLTGSTALGVPLAHESHLYGVLMARAYEADFFDPARVELAEHIGALLGTALRNTARFDRLVALEDRYRRLFETASAPMLLTDTRGRIVKVNNNAAELFGYPAHAMLNVPITSLFDIGKDTLQAVAHAGQDESEAVFDASGRTALGDGRTLRVRARRIRLNERERLLWTLDDVTEKQQQEQLQRDLAAMTYHDLRNMLNNIMGSVARLDRMARGEQDPTFYQLVDIAQRSTQQLSRMISTLLELERLEAGVAKLDKRPTILPVLLADAVELLALRTRDAGQELVIDVREDVPAVMADFDMILRVVTNLIENAVKYTPGGGRITLSARLRHDSVRVSIKDTGPGIPAELREQIFDKYVRVKHRQAQGVGLGLAFCRMAVEAHGGRIWVEADPHEPGAVFCFTLPADQQPATVKA